jgi:hypothetical protein
LLPIVFPEEKANQLNQDEIIEIMDQSKARNPEWHAAILMPTLKFFKMSYK